VVQDKKGVSDFNALFYDHKKPVYIASDLLWLDGRDLRQTPLLERRQLLREFLGGLEGPLGFSEAWEGDGRDLLAAADEARHKRLSLGPREELAEDEVLGGERADTRGHRQRPGRRADRALRPRRAEWPAICRVGDVPLSEGR